jgi:cytochrome P450
MLGRGERVIADLTEPLPLLIIGEMLSLPPEDRARFRPGRTTSSPTAPG